MIFTAVIDAFIFVFGALVAHAVGLKDESHKPYWVPFLAGCAAVGNGTLLVHCTRQPPAALGSYNVFVLVFSPLVLSGAALWATMITWRVCIDEGCKDMQGFYVIVTVSKAFQGLTLHNTGLALKLENDANAAAANHANILAAVQ